jgi:CBS domain-containing protein
VDALAHAIVKDYGLRPVDTLKADDTLEAVRAWLASGAAGTSHQGFPVVSAEGQLVGVVTRRDLLDGTEPAGRRVRDLIRRPAAVVFEDSSLREAADHMVREGVGRLPVVRRHAPTQVVGIITRSDLLAAHQRRLDDAFRQEQGIGGTRPPLSPHVPSTG